MGNTFPYEKRHNSHVLPGIFASARPPFSSEIKGSRQIKNAFHRGKNGGHSLVEVLPMSLDCPGSLRSPDSLPYPDCKRRHCKHLPRMTPGLGRDWSIPDLWQQEAVARCNSEKILLCRGYGGTSVVVQAPTALKSAVTQRCYSGSASRRRASKSRGRVSIAIEPSGLCGHSSFGRSR